MTGKPMTDKERAMADLCRCAHCVADRKAKRKPKSGAK